MPSKIYDDHEMSVTTVAGTGSVNMQIPTRGSAVLFYVQPLTSTTQWDMKVIDPKDRVLRHYEEEVGTMVDDGEELPLYGIYTFTILNATRDELFNIFVRVEQVHG